MGNMFAWATPNYLLDCMSIEQIFLYYDYGVEFEENKARMIINELGKALNGKEEQNGKDTGDKPDKEAFYKHYGNQIKQPKGGQNK